MQRQNSRPISKIEIENWFPNSPRLETDTGTPCDIFSFSFSTSGVLWKEEHYLKEIKIGSIIVPEETGLAYLMAGW